MSGGDGDGAPESGSDVIVRLMRDCNRVEGWLRMLVVDVPQVLALAITSIIFLWAISWRIMLIALSPFPVVLLVALAQARRLNLGEGSVQSAEGTLFARIGNMLAHMQTANAYNAEAFEFNRLGRASRRYRDATLSYWNFSSLLSPVVRMIVLTGLAGSLLMGSYWLLSSVGTEKAEDLTMGKLLFVLLLLTMVLWPSRTAGNRVQAQLKGMASMRRILVLLDLAPKLAPRRTPSVSEVHVREAEVTFTDVCLSRVVDVCGREKRGGGGGAHVGGMVKVQRVSVLSDFSLEVAAGSAVAVYAPAGGGKTALVDLLLRRREAHEGSVCVNGYRLSEMSATEVRRVIALLPQHTYLHKGTIAENINYGRMRAGDEHEVAARMVKASGEARLHSMVCHLPHGYETAVEEADELLSYHGLRRRIGLARCLFKDAPVVVMDNPTQECDANTRRMLCRCLVRMLAGKTALVLSDDMALVRHFPRIVVLHEGRVVEDGTHHSLLHNTGIYASMWEDYTGAG
eukprot:TRINITY_DN23379_c0_g1_i1.p1 TRINITY_DN23379_c0_g1~~TRINITY_DN23379_c0_g1_i1.p1  ORF type:complete len:547 (-),score=216.09 TRINITY_DN23379_c0_g1_i1:62-1603(-)